MTDDPNFHKITERPDGPDLFDIIRLTEYLRSHGMDVALGRTPKSPSVRASWNPRPLPDRPRSPRPPEAVVEGQACRKGAVFVDPDGTLCNAKGEAL